MKNYEKPLIVENEDLSEGIYAASGTVTSVGDVTAVVTFFDHYGNYYFKVSGFENAAKYNIVLTVANTALVNGLNSASWGGFGGTVNGNTVTFTGVCFANQTDWHVRLWFNSQGDWEYGWCLSDKDIPKVTISITKITS